jgi:hypothetical protein
MRVGGAGKKCVSLLACLLIDHVFGVISQLVHSLQQFVAPLISTFLGKDLRFCLKRNGRLESKTNRRVKNRKTIQRVEILRAGIERRREAAKMTLYRRLPNWATPVVGTQISKTQPQTITKTRKQSEKDRRSTSQFSVRDWTKMSFRGRQLTDSERARVLEFQDNIHYSPRYVFELAR